MHPFTKDKGEKNKQKQNITKKGAKQLQQFFEEINNFKKEESGIQSKLQRKIPTMSIYNLVNIGNSVYKLHKRVNLQQFKDYFFLNENSKSKIVGFTPDYIGINPAKPVVKFNYFNEFCVNNIQQIKNKYNNLYKSLIKVLNKPRISYNGGYDSSSLHLRVIFSENPTKYKRDEILNILQKSNFKWFNSPVVQFINKEELLWATGYNPKSKPGHYTSKLFKNTKRGQSIHASLHAAIKLYEMVRHQPFRNYYLWEILGREKDIKINGINKAQHVSARVVLSTEETATLLQCHFAQKITKALSTADNKFDIEGQFDYKKSQKYYENRFHYDYYVDADWKGFDSNVEGVFIEVALAILLCELASQDKFHMRISFYIIQSVLVKYIAVPPGIVVECQKGVPSGSPFTTISNCYINIVYWCLIGYNIYGDNYADNMELTVYGDDAIVWFKEHPNLYKIDTYIKEIGIKSEPIFEKLYPTKLFSKLTEEPDFLKRHFNSFEIYWNPIKRFEKIIYQSKNRTINEQILQILGYQETSPFDKEFNNLVEFYLQELLFKYGNKIDNEIITKIKNNKETVENLEKNFIFDPNINKHNEGYHKEMSLAQYKFESFSPEIDTNTKKQIIKQKDIDLLVLLGFPPYLINSVYENYILSLLNEMDIKYENFMDNRVISASFIAFEEYKRWLHPP